MDTEADPARSKVAKETKKHVGPVDLDAPFWDRLEEAKREGKVVNRLGQKIPSGSETTFLEEEPRKQ